MIKSDKNLLKGFTGDNDSLGNEAEMNPEIVRYNEGYNQALSDLASKQVGLDREEIINALMSPNCDVAISFDRKVAEYLADALIANEKKIIVEVKK